MRKFGGILGRVLMALVLLVAIAFALDPRPQIAPADFDAASLPDDLDAYLAATESAIPGITDGTQKQILWHGEKDRKTPWSVVYLHGYSATSQEIRPVPDQIATALSANLFLTRLAGHGLNGAAMASATPEDWLKDTAEAMAIARRLGDRILVLATSTGGTLAAFVATDPALGENVAGIVMISPNFGVTPAGAFILNLPLAPFWGPVLAGPQRTWTPRNDLQARYWTTSYPTSALFPMRDLVNASVKLDYSKALIPALTARVLTRWAGPVTVEHPEMTPRDDPMSHVIAGDILSPGQTAQATARILHWVEGL